MARFPKARPAILTATLAVLLVVALVACSNPQNTFDPKSDAANEIFDLYVFIIFAASFVGAAVLIAMVWLLIKFRARPGHEAQQIHGNNKLEVAWTIAPILVLVAIGIPSIAWVANSEDAAGPDGVEITAIGHQWWFEFRYPGLGPDGGDLITANELHIPIGKDIAITLESDDVIHSFWVPKLVGKTDMMPGNINTLQVFKPNEVGVFFGQCAEFCGSAHGWMRFRVHVDTLADFDDWVEGMKAPPAEPEPGSAAARGQLLFASCSGCHAISGTAAQGRIGPDLTLFGERLTLAAGIRENTDANLRQWIGDVRSVKPIEEGPQFMPTFAGTFSDQEIGDIAAYLRSLTLE